MALIVGDISDHIVSHAMASGFFDQVNSHEPKNAPGNGLTYSIWLKSVRPIKEVSGLDSTSAVVEFSGRVMVNMLQEPQDQIDANLGLAVDALMNAYTGDFTFDSTVMEIDVLGAYTNGLSCECGYVDQDSKNYRVAVITLPVVVSDVWTQEA